MTTFFPQPQSQEVFYPSSDGEPLQLRLEIEGQLIAFYREDTGEKLLAPAELVQRLQQEILVRQQAEKRAQQAELQVEILKEKLKALGVDPDTISTSP